MSRFSAADFLIVFGVLLITCSESISQVREVPRITLDFQGPAGKTRTLGFMASDQQIFAGGENKFLQTYLLAGDSVVRGNTIRWENGRSLLGGINAGVVSDDGKFVFFGGAAPRPAQLVAIADSTGRIVASIPGIPGQLLSLACSGDGSKLVTAEPSGRIRMWVTGDNWKTFQSQVIQGEDVAAARDFCRVAFGGEGLILYEAKPGIVAFRRIIQGEMHPAERVSGSFQSTVTGISASQNGDIIALADFNGLLRIHRNGPGSPGSQVKLPFQWYRIRNLTVSPDGTVCAVMGDTMSPDNQPRSFVSLIDTATLRILSTASFRGFENCVAAAFDRSSKQLLTHDDFREVLLVWDLKNLNNPLPDPLSRPPVVIAGRGLIVSEVGFSTAQSTADQGYLLRFRDSQNRVAQFFPGSLKGDDPRIPEMQQLQTDQLTGVNSADEFSNGWKIEFGVASTTTQEILLTSPRGTRSKILHDVEKQGPANGVYCFIPGSNQKAVAVAVASTRLDQIYVYGLTRLNGGEFKSTDVLRRYFRDHNGVVTSLSVSTDGRYLVSSAADKTLRIWSLEGLTDGVRKSLFGGGFETNERRQFVATGLQKSGILYARGLRDGDEISLVYHPDLPSGTKLRGPGEIAKAIQDLSPFAYFDFWTERKGLRVDDAGLTDDRIRITPGWEPLLTVVVDKIGEWAAFTPEGYYDSSIADGNELFGWQINQGPDKSPRFEPAAHFQKDFEKPEVIRDVLRLGNVPDALAAAGLAAPDDLRQALKDKVLTLPSVSIIEPRDGAALGGGRTQLKIQVEYPNPQVRRQFRVDVAEDGRPIPGNPVRTLSPDQRTEVVSWDIEPDSSRSTLRFDAVVRENGSRSLTESLHDTATSQVRLLTRQTSPASPEPVRLHLIAFAIDQYVKAIPLEFSKLSVEYFVADLLKSSGVVTESPKVLVDGDVNRQSVRELLTKAVQGIKSRNDILVVVINGHGDLAPKLTPRPKENPQFYFLPADVDPSNPQDIASKGIHWNDVSEPINAAPCHVLWVVDACKAGNVSSMIDSDKRAEQRYSEKRILRDASGTGQGRYVILGSGLGDSLAAESNKLYFEKSERGNTVLMTAIREAIQRRTIAFLESSDDPNQSARSSGWKQILDNLWSDNVLTMEELGNYCIRRVPSLTRDELRLNAQTAIFSPRTLLQDGPLKRNPLALLSTTAPAD